MIYFHTTQNGRHLYGCFEGVLGYANHYGLTIIFGLNYKFKFGGSTESIRKLDAVLETYPK